jgi:tungstate transport system substrate-binding protein
VRRRRRLISFAIGLALAQVSLASAQEKSIVVASTTSTEDSGLFGFILLLFKQKRRHAPGRGSQRSLFDV